MNKTLLIARYEYSHHVFTKRFWITLLSMPIAIVLVMLLSMYMSISAINTDPAGYVDKAGLMTLDQEIPGKKGFLILRFPSWPTQMRKQPNKRSGLVPSRGSTSSPRGMSPPIN